MCTMRPWFHSDCPLVSLLLTRGRTDGLGEGAASVWGSGYLQTINWNLFSRNTSIALAGGVLIISEPHLDRLIPSVRTACLQFSVFLLAAAVKFTCYIIFIRFILFLFLPSSARGSDGNPGVEYYYFLLICNIIIIIINNNFEIINNY